MWENTDRILFENTWIARLLIASLSVLLGLSVFTGCSVATEQHQMMAFSSEVTDKPAPDISPTPTTITFAAYGDIICHDQMIAQYRTGTGSYDFSGVFAPIAEDMRSYDLTSITQETPLTDDEGSIGGYPVFGTPTAMGDAIVEAGVDIVTSATNHSMDQGIDGIDKTIAYWKTKHPEITLMGVHDDPSKANSVTVIEKEGVKIALTDCTYGLNGFVLPDGREYEVDMLDDIDIIADNIRAIEKDVDITIAYVHMGEEYATVPSNEQREVAAKLIDAGADVVLGSHVHVVQPMEEMTTETGNHGIVYYSIGNFASNQIDIENMLGGAAILTIEKAPNEEGTATTTKVIDYKYRPVFCQYESGSTQMYYLANLTDDMAARHYISYIGKSFSATHVRDLWTSITGREVV